MLGGLASPHSSAPPPEPIPVVAALILDRGRWLVAQRPANKHLGGKWEFPGGKVHDGEDPRDALIREIREELGCTIEVLSAVAPYVHDYGTVRIRLIPYTARLAAPGARPVALEHSALRWAAHDEIAVMDLAPADLPLVALLPGLAGRPQ